MLIPSLQRAPWQEVMFRIPRLLTGLLVAVSLVHAAAGSSPIFPPNIGSAGSVKMAPHEVLALREKVREMFSHGYDKYARSIASPSASFTTCCDS